MTKKEKEKKGQKRQKSKKKKKKILKNGKFQLISPELGQKMTATGIEPRIRSWAISRNNTKYNNRNCPLETTDALTHLYAPPSCLILPQVKKPLTGIIYNGKAATIQTLDQP